MVRTIQVTEAQCTSDQQPDKLLRNRESKQTWWGSGKPYELEPSRSRELQGSTIALGFWELMTAFAGRSECPKSNLLNSEQCPMITVH